MIYRHGKWSRNLNNPELEFVGLYLYKKRYKIGAELFMEIVNTIAKQASI